MPLEVATEPPFLSHPPPLSDGNLHPAALLRMRGNYFRPYLSIFTCAIEVQHNNENSTTIKLKIAFISKFYSVTYLEFLRARITHDGSFGGKLSSTVDSR